MERRRALAIAAATAVSTVSAVVAIAANFGLLGFGQAPPNSVGKLEAGRVVQVSNPAATSPTTAGVPPAGDPGTVPGVGGVATPPSDDTSGPTEFDNGDHHHDDEGEHDGGRSEDDD